MEPDASEVTAPLPSIPDPPMPVPDVTGADATVRGLPRRVDLTWRQKLIVDSSAVADIGLRTAIASVVGAAMVPRVARAALNPSSSHAENEALHQRLGRRIRSSTVACLLTARRVARARP